MTIKSCKFIEASEVFKDCPLAWELFVNGDPACTWGDNNRSMVTPDVIFTFLELADVDEGPTNTQVNLAISRLKDIPENTYVDLEN